MLAHVLLNLDVGNDLVERCHARGEVHIFGNSLHLYLLVHRFVVTELYRDHRSLRENLPYFKMTLYMYLLNCFEYVLTLVRGAVWASASNVLSEAFVDKRLDVNAKVQPLISLYQSVRYPCVH